MQFSKCCHSNAEATDSILSFQTTHEDKRTQVSFITCNYTSQIIYVKLKLFFTYRNSIDTLTYNNKIIFKFLNLELKKCYKNGSSLGNFFN